MANLRLVEHYVSVQGEGPRVGELTQFVRFAGCNMRCPLWPCDTQHAIDPKIYRNNSRHVTPDELYDQIRRMPGNVCLTGGEPFMQNNEKLEELVTLVTDDGKHVECFSNASFRYPLWALDKVSFIVDWKLEGSGEQGTQLVTRLSNVQQLGAFERPEKHAVKFTIASLNDLYEALAVWKDLSKMGLVLEYYVGAVWGKISNEEIVNFMVDEALPWKLNVQIHKYVWDPDKQGV